jgi:ATP-dependent RNA helicase CshB
LIYRNNQDNLINNLIRKGIKWNFQLIKDDKLINREKKLHFRKKILLDQSINASIKRIYVQGTKKVKPCYKKKIKLKINKIKQKQRHLFIEKKIKQNLLLKNIKNSKCDKNKIT